MDTAGNESALAEYAVYPRPVRPPSRLARMEWKRVLFGGVGIFLLIGGTTMMVTSVSLYDWHLTLGGGTFLPGLVVAICGFSIWRISHASHSKK